MSIAKTDMVERIARVLAGQRLSVNGEGSEQSAALAVDEAWLEHVEDALVILRTMREPDERMALIGDAEAWSRMIRAALSEA